MISSLPDNTYVVKPKPKIKPFATSKKFTLLTRLVEKQYQSVTGVTGKIPFGCEQRMGRYMFSVELNLLSASF